MIFNKSLENGVKTGKIGGPQVFDFLQIFVQNNMEVTWKSRKILGNLLQNLGRILEFCHSQRVVTLFLVWAKYLPPASCGKVLFSQVCAILSRGGIVPSHHTPKGPYPQDHTPTPRSIPPATIEASGTHPTGMLSCLDECNQRGKMYLC